MWVLIVRSLGEDGDGDRGEEQDERRGDDGVLASPG
jgi:hypothetical protein